MDWEQRRLLEMAGLLRRRTPDHLLTEGDDEEDPFADTEEDKAGGEDAEASTDAPAENKEPPEELSPEEVEQYGSPRFFEVENRVTQMFNNAKTSATAASQGQEGYPGVAEPEEAESTPAKDEEADEKNESFYRFGNRRDKWLLKEANRLLTEADDEGISAESFDMERFCNEFGQYMESVDFVSDIQHGLFNFARQMILNNFQDPATEQKFISMLKGKLTKDYDFIPAGSEAPDEIPVAAGASGGGGGA